jgi:lipopolysaccharide export system permease protein
MKILDFYIARTVIGGTLMTILVLSALMAFVDFVGEIGDVGTRGYHLADALFYVLLALPKHIYSLFPTAVLLGSLLALGTLAGNSELVVMRAAGISVSKIVRWVLQAGLVLAVLNALVGEVLVPVSERKAQNVRATALKQNITLGGQHGFWMRDGTRYLRVGRVYPDMQLGDLYVYEVDKSRNVSRITYARSAIYNNGVWSLRKVSHTLFGEQQITTETHEEIEWPGLLNPDLFSVVSVDPEDMPALDLYRYSSYLQDNDLDASHYRQAFWVKIMTPLSSMVMLLIALPFVFGSQRSGSAGNRMVIGLLLGIGFFIANRIMNHFGQVYGITPFISAASPVVLVMMASVFALRRVK